MSNWERHPIYIPVHYIGNLANVLSLALIALDAAFLFVAVAVVTIHLSHMHAVPAVVLKIGNTMGQSSTGLPTTTHTCRTHSPSVNLSNSVTVSTDKCYLLVVSHQRILFRLNIIIQKLEMHLNKITLALLY